MERSVGVIRVIGLETREREDTSDDLEELIRLLRSRDGLERLRARKAVVAKGREAVPSLVKTLSSRNWVARWEAAKALAQIAHPSAAEALVLALEDPRPGVRWVAGDGLASMDKAALPPLLRVLMKRADSPQLRLGALHVCRRLAGRGYDESVAQLIAALQGASPELTVPIVAQRTLHSLRSA